MRWDYAVDEMPGGQGEPEDRDMSLHSSQATGDGAAVGAGGSAGGGGGGGAAAAAAVRALSSARGSKRVRAENRR